MPHDGHPGTRRGIESKSDDELLRLALQSEQLTAEANAALQTELIKRRLNAAERLNAFRLDEQEYRKEEDRNPRLFTFRGLGRKRFGKADCVYDPSTGLERFKTTVFVVLFWFPLIPTGTYLAERKREFLSDEITFLEKLPLDWEQVLKMWVVASAILLAAIWAFKFLPRLLLH